MTADHRPPSITLPASSVTRLADLLTELDEFLRSSGIVSDALAAFLARCGHTYPLYSANILIDDVSFTAARLRTLTSQTSRAAADARPTGYPGDNHQQDA